MANGKKVYYFINLGFVLSRLKIMSVNGQIRLVPIKQGKAHTFPSIINHSSCYK